MRLLSLSLLLLTLSLSQKNYASVNTCENLFSYKYISISKVDYSVTDHTQLFEFRFPDFKDFIQTAGTLTNSHAKVIGFKHDDNENTVALILLTPRDAKRLKRDLEIDGIAVEYYTIPEKAYSKLDLIDLETFEMQKTPDKVQDTISTGQIISEIQAPPTTTPAKVGRIKKILYSLTFSTGSSEYLMQAFQQRGMKVISVQEIGDTLVITAESYPLEFASFVSQQTGFREGHPLGIR